ncbi:D-aminoacyl-tRNA deacylase 2-like [Clavelina lepadiformis]|uniref:D-aminoacyl-tRNA deacylase 2-like n=1 Tax=Clavelina lepadiformis TaxID=159417 RepID=UPI0040418F09
MDARSITGRIVLQQCIGAKLQVKPLCENSPAEYVEIGRGVVAYVCFMKGANSDTVGKMISMITSIKLSRNGNGLLVSVLDLPGSIMVVPQGCLGGKLKGKRMQYHGNIDKLEGLKLYESLTLGCCNALPADEGVTCKYGTYGNLQVLKVDTDGPYMHTIDIT